jgi:hypothetical protein
MYLRPPRIGDVEGALVRREGEPVRILEVGEHGDRAARIDAIDRGIRQLPLRERHPQARVGEVDAPVGAAHDVVGPVEALALVAVAEDLDLPVRARPGDAPVAALAHDEPALEIERRAIALAGVLAEDLGLAARREPVEHALPHVDEVVEAVGMPQRSLGEDESGGQALRLRGVEHC